MNKIIVSRYSKHRPDAPYVKEGLKSSVHFMVDYDKNSKQYDGSTYRLKKAMEEIQYPPPENNDVVLSVAGKFFEVAQIPVTIIKSAQEGTDPHNLIWIKSLESRHIGVIGSGKVNFDMPPSPVEYDKKDEKGNWIWNSAGILIHYLGVKLERDLRWDKSGVLAFRLREDDISQEYCLERIKRAMGNWMIENGMHIIDYYNHQIEKCEYSGN